MNAKRIRVIIAQPLELHWPTIDTSTDGGKLMLRRVALEALGWRVHYEPHLNFSWSGHYVFWVGPENQMNSEWWTEGNYEADPGYHWNPPDLGIGVLLRGYDYEIYRVVQDGAGAWEYRIDAPHVKSRAVDFDQEVAALSVLLGVLRPDRVADNA